jgi:hypothetical protein
MLRIICLNAENYLGMGKQYVEILHDMVMRNLAGGHEGKFVCFTDDPEPYAVGIEKRELPCLGLNGWWNKLSLFRDDLFPEGDRILYFDLDTLITGRLDEIVKYDGEFAPGIKHDRPGLRKIDEVLQVNRGQRLGCQLADEEPQRIGRGLPGIDPAAQRRHHRGHIGRGLTMKFDLVHAHPPRGKA